jgi:hypothetical protein
MQLQSWTPIQREILHQKVIAPMMLFLRMHLALHPSTPCRWNDFVRTDIQLGISLLAVSSDPTIPSSSSDITSSPEQPADHDVDAADWADELFAAEYAGEIYNYLKDNESRSMVNPAYMLRQTDINAKMRVILNDWLVEVQ